MRDRLLLYKVPIVAMGMSPIKAPALMALILQSNQFVLHLV